MRTIGLCLALAVTAALPASAGAGTAAAPAGVHTVLLKNIAIHPATIRIHRGDTVRWLFRDRAVSHNVTSQGAMRFRSSSSRLSGSYSVRFTRRGTYRYHCTIHPSMLGRVVVG
jgi:plastocyanin